MGKKSFGLVFTNKNVTVPKQIVVFNDGEDAGQFSTWDETITRSVVFIRFDTEESANKVSAFLLSNIFTIDEPVITVKEYDEAFDLSLMKDNNRVIHIPNNKDDVHYLQFITRQLFERYRVKYNEMVKKLKHEYLTSMHIATGFGRVLSSLGRR